MKIFKNKKELSRFINYFEGCLTLKSNNEVFYGNKLMAKLINK